MSGSGAEPGSLPGGEVAVGNGEGIAVGGDAFQIDPHLPATGKRREEEVVAVGDVEAQVEGPHPCQGRLAVGTVTKFQGFRCFAQIGAKDTAQNGPGRNEAGAGQWGAESPGALLLVRGKEGVVGSGCVGAEGGAPDVELVVRDGNERDGHGRGFVAAVGVFPGARNVILRPEAVVRTSQGGRGRLPLSKTRRSLSG